MSNNELQNILKNNPSAICIKRADKTSGYLISIIESSSKLSILTENQDYIIVTNKITQKSDKIKLTVKRKPLTHKIRALKYYKSFKTPNFSKLIGIKASLLQHSHDNDTEIINACGIIFK